MANKHHGLGVGHMTPNLKVAGSKSVKGSPHSSVPWILVWNAGSSHWA